MGTVAGLPRADGVAMVLAFGAAAWLGRAAERVSLPAPLAWLAVGVASGPALGEAVGQAWTAWPLPDGLLSRGVLKQIDMPLGVATLVSAFWVGRRLAPRELGGTRRAIVGLVIGHVAVVAGVVAGIAWAVAPTGLGMRAAEPLPDEIGEWVGLAAALVATSWLLVGATVHAARAAGPLTRVVLWVAVVGELVAMLVLGAWQSTLGGAATWARLHPWLPEEVAFAAGIGVLVGGIAAAGARWAPAVTSPWFMGVTVVTGVAAEQVGLAGPVVGLAAGATLAVLVPQAAAAAFDRFARLGFVVLLVVAGASTPFAALLSAAPLAAVIAPVRAVLVIGAGVAVARALRAPARLVRYGWTGLAASSVPVFGLVRWRGFTSGASVSELTGAMWGLSALDGVLGILAVHVAVRLAEETPHRADDASDRPVGWDAPERVPKAAYATA